MIVNYSGQPFEPVYDMHLRTNCSGILYEEVETVRIIGKGEDCKFASIPYGMLKATSESDRDLRKLKRRLNEDYKFFLKVEVSGEFIEEQGPLLPKQSSQSIFINRLEKYIPTHHDVKLLSSCEYMNLKDFTISVEHGLYLCKYLDNSRQIRIQVLASSGNGASLVKFRRSLCEDIGWKYAVIDYRLEREQYTSKKSGYAVSYKGDEGNMTQTEIDDHIATILKNDSV